MRRFVPSLAVLLLLALPPVAAAQSSSGGATMRDGGTGDGGTQSGDLVTATPEPEVREKQERKAPKRRAATKKKRKAKPGPSRGRPILTAFDVSPGRFFIYGTPARVTFQIDDRSRTVRARLSVYRRGGGAPLQRIALGDVRTGEQHVVRLNGRDGGVLPQGDLEVRISARDRTGKTLRRSARTSRSDTVSFYWHRHPLLGAFSYGNEGSRFGAPRTGHTHQGQDLSAPLGTSVIAPRGGVVDHVAFQREGAGHYVVVNGAGENRSYVFMHLRTGTVRVRQGQRVRTGQRIGDVGNTGASSGPHLHFEIWIGGWFSGGNPIDPLPYLKRWGQTS